MQDRYYEVTCTPVCGFVVRSHDRDETVDLALHHGTMKHPEMEPTPEKVRSEWLHEVVAKR